jgi:hypothetical protein
MIEDLSELIRALDRRMPRLERSGEIKIAQDAAALRNQALERIARLEEVGAGATG